MYDRCVSTWINKSTAKMKKKRKSNLCIKNFIEITGQYNYHYFISYCHHNPKIVPCLGVHGKAHRM